MKSKILISTIAILCSAVSFAQYNASLLPMANMHQNIRNNPAYLPESNFSVGIPALSGISVKAAFTGFPLGGIFSSGESQLSVNDLVGKLNPKNALLTDVGLDAFNFNIKVKDYSFSFSSTVRVNSQLIIPKDLALVALEGNGAYLDPDNPADLSGLSANTSAYYEIAVGGSMPITNKVRLGARLKYLQGIVNVETVNTDFKLATNGNTNYAIRVTGEYEVKTAGFSDEFSEENAMPLASANKGFGIDLGATYQFSEKLQLSASILDVGFIHWKDSLKLYNTNAFDFYYEGADVFDLAGEEGESGSDFFESLQDSLSESFDANESPGEAYKTSLVSRFIVGGEYKLTNKNFVGITFAGEMIPNLFQPYITGHYRFQLGKTINALVSNSFAYNSGFNPGFGFSAKLGPLQFYCASDNFLGLIEREAARSAHVALGFNLVFGGKKAKETVTAPVPAQ